MKCRKTDRTRILRYVGRYHLRHEREEWPTVRQVAAALRLRQDEVEMEGYEVPLMLTSYGANDALGNHFVEICA